MTPQYKLWADACAQSFGGLEIVTVDALHRAEDGKEFILEMNGTSSGSCGTSQTVFRRAPCSNSFRCTGISSAESEHGHMYVMTSCDF